LQDTKTLKRTASSLLAVWALTAFWATAQQSSDQACQVRVVTDPEGAMVYCDGVMQDTAPLTISDLREGDHIITAEKPGYNTARKSISLTKGQRIPVELALQQVMGLVLVHSDPPGAEVQVSGAVKGRTPLLITDLPPDKYRLRLEARGYAPKEVDLVVKDRIPQKLSVSLTSDSATLTITTEPPGANVLVNGISKGTTPCTVDRIPDGDNTLKLTLDGYEDHTQTLRLSAGEQQDITVALNPMPAQLTVVSIPLKARIYVKNEFRGESPLVLKSLEPGTYRIRAELRGHEVLARNVDLKRGDEKVEEFRLARNCGMLVLTTEPSGVKVFIDGEVSGTTAVNKTETDVASDPLEMDLLPIGAHQVQLTKKGFYNVTFSIEIEKDKTVTKHVRMKRRFIPNYELRTADGVFRGVLVQQDNAGNVKIETKPGIIQTFMASEIISLRPIRTKPEE
jgi:hypothetical protein